MENHIKILLLEDNLGDVGLIKHELLDGKIDFSMKHVITKMEFLRELEEFQPDIILSDYTIPGFSGTEALALAKELTPSIPVIIVTGTIDEETAVACMKAGAVDYVLKDSIRRIAPAVTSAIQKRKINEEKALIEDKLKFAVNILENIRDSIIVTDMQGKILYWNKGATLLFGYTSEEMLGNTTVVLYPDKNEQQYLYEMSSLIEAKEYIGEWKGIKKNGEIVWIYIKVSILQDKNDKIIGFLGVSKDITEIKKIEESLRNSETRANILLNSIPDLILRINRELTLLDIRIPRNLNFNKSAHELIGKNFTELSKTYSFLSREIIEQISYHTMLTFKTGKIQTFDYKFFLSENIYYFELRFALCNQDEVLLLIRDITTSSEIEKNSNSIKINESEHIQPGVIYHSLEGKILEANIEMANILEYSSPEELIKMQKIHELSDEPKLFDEIISSLIIHEIIVNKEIKLKKKDGQNIPVILDAKMVKDKNKNQVYFELKIRNIINENNLEIQIQHAQKLEAIKTMTSRIAYDFNNIISLLSMNLYISEEELPEIHPFRENLKNIKEIIGQASELSERILNFNQILKS